MFDRLFYHAALILIVIGGMPARVPGAEFPPEDHGGADLVLGDGDVIWGRHSHVGTFRTTAGTTATVRAFSSFVVDSGNVRIEAQNIELQGVLSAEGAGYPGGTGGEGTAPPNCAPFTTCIGEPGDLGTPGAGPAGGTIGGYVTVGTNGDVSKSDSVVIGSGGQGGQGGAGFCLLGCGFGERGGEGGNGGGSIELIAAEHFSATASAVLQANGTRGGYYEGYAGRNPDTAAKPGAGGGILIELGRGASAEFQAGVTLESRGGDGSLLNGGTAKVILANGAPAPDLSKLNVSVGRLFTRPEAGIDLWGAWTRPLEYKQKRMHGAVDELLQATWSVLNQGKERSGAALVRFYLSTDENLDAGDTIVQDSTVHPLRGGGRKKIKVRLNDLQATAGLYLIAVVDKALQVPETQEKNNESRTGPVN
jgi:hypothetical protein